MSGKLLKMVLVLTSYNRFGVVNAEGSGKGSSYEEKLCEEVLKKQKKKCCLEAASRKWL